MLIRREKLSVENRVVAESEREVKKISQELFPHYLTGVLIERFIRDVAKPQQGLL